MFARKSERLAKTYWSLIYCFLLLPIFIMSDITTKLSITFNSWCVPFNAHCLKYAHFLQTHPRYTRDRIKKCLRGKNGNVHTCQN